MQGYLQIWHGFFSRWSKYYFRLFEETLIFGPNKDQIQGKIHLKVSQIVSTIDDPVSLIIHTGTQTMRLRASSIDERVRWYKKLKNTQKKAQQANYHKQMQQVDKQLGKNSKIKVLQQLTVQLWQCHAVLENIIDDLAIRFKGLLNSKNLTDRLRITAQQIKLKNSEALKIIQEQTANLKDKKIGSESLRLLENSMMNYSGEKSYYNSTKFMSFAQKDDQNPKLKSKKSVQSNMQKKYNNQTKFFSFDEPKESHRKMAIKQHSEVSNYKLNSERQNNTHSQKLKLLNENQVFRQTIKYIDNSEYRQQLPQKVMPQEKFSMMSMLSGVGSDLTRFTFPVTINEPLSLLQKTCEQMYYSNLLQQANKSTDPQTRMLYVAAFLVSCYSLSENRVKKPFNPLLGETFEYIDNERQFEFFSEQVSHHPPISAVHCRSNNFEIIDNTSSKTTFTGTSIKIIPESKGKIILQKLKDQYKFNKCTLSMNNLLMGKLYIENYGQLTIDCPKNQTKAVLQFKQQSFWNKNQTNMVEGVIKKGDKQCYLLKGRWSEILHATDVRNNSIKVIWKKTHQQNPQNYFFNDYTLQLNHLNKQTFQAIAPTDSRLRPDQRALQFQKLDFAASQKNRLEQKQRKRRKENEKNSKNHEILWFTKQYDEEGQQVYISNGKYWEQRYKGNWDMCLDIY